jgi:hypothetical protein
MEKYKSGSLEQKNPAGYSGDMDMKHSTPRNTEEHLSAMDNQELANDGAKEL